MTTPKPGHDTGDDALIGRRTVLRGGLAGGLALAAVLLESALSGVEAKPKPKKPAKPVKPTKAKAADTGSNGSNNSGDTTGSPTNGNSNTGGSNTGQSGTGNNAGPGAPSTGNSNTGANSGHDTTGTNVSKPPVTGPDNKQPTLKCTTKGDQVIAGPAGSPPTVIPGGKTCVEVP